MARGEQSRVTFSVNIENIKDAREYSKLLSDMIKKQKEFIKTFEEAEKVQSKARQTKKQEPSSSTTAGGVRDSVSGMELRVMRGEIDTVQKLSAAYGSLVNQINALERQGKSVNNLRVQAQKQHDKLRQVIDARVQANRDLTGSKIENIKTQRDSFDSTQEWIQAMREAGATAQEVELATMKSSEAIATQSDTYRNSAYVVLNAGYLVQDSPYGFRGVSNNISQLVQAWELLRRRTLEQAESTGEVISTFQALKKDLSGRMGVVFLLGSVMPAALVLAQRAWEAYKKRQEESNKATEDSISTLRDFISLHRNLTIITGSDPLGIIASRDDIKRMSDTRDELQKYHDAIKEIIDFRNRQFASRSQGMGMGFVSPEEIERSKEISENFESISKELGAISGIDLKKLNEQIKELDHNIALSERFLDRSQIAQMEGRFSQMTDSLVERLKVFSDEISDPDVLNQVRLRAGMWLEVMEREFLEGDFDVKRMAKTYMDRLRSALEDEDSDEDDIHDPFDSLLALRLHNAERSFEISRSTEEKIRFLWEEHAIRMDQLSREQFDDEHQRKLAEIQLAQEFTDRYKDIRRSEVDAIYDIRLHDAERRFDLATNTQDRISGLWNEHALRLEDIRREDFHSEEEYDLAKIQLAQEFTDRYKMIINDQALFELRMKNHLLENDLYSESNINDRLSNIEEYYDRKAEIIKKSYDDENELAEQLFLNEQERRRANEESEREYHEAKNLLILNSATLAVTSAQTVANFLAEDRRAQWEINKYSQAGMATISALLAYNQTMAAGGGFFSMALAKVALVTGLANAAKILSQKYGKRGSSGGSGGGFSGLSSYRGFDTSEHFTDSFSGNYQPFSGSSSVSEKVTDSSSIMPDKVKAEFTDGFGRVVSQGTLQLQSQGKGNLGYWQSGR